MKALGRPFLVVGVLVAGLGTQASAGPPEPHVRARLLAEGASIQPGVAFDVGLQLLMDPGWHTYWKNPGDSGLPTRISWRLPEGFTIEPLRWPTPTAFNTGPLTSYGYGGEVLLMARVTPPARLSQETSVTLAGRASWLECQEICVPGKAEVSLSLPVKAAPPGPSPDAPVFDRARRRLPRPASDWHITVSTEPSRLVLVARPPAKEGVPKSGLRFFPEEPGYLEASGEQRQIPTGDGFRMELALEPNARLPEAVRGLLVPLGKGAGPLPSFYVEVPIRARASSKKGAAP